MTLRKPASVALNRLVNQIKELAHDAANVAHDEDNLYCETVLDNIFWKIAALQKHI